MCITVMMSAVYKKFKIKVKGGLTQRRNDATKVSNKSGMPGFKPLRRRLEAPTSGA